MGIKNVAIMPGQEASKLWGNLETGFVNDWSEKNISFYIKAFLSCIKNNEFTEKKSIVENAIFWAKQRLARKGGRHDQFLNQIIIGLEK